VRSSLAFFVTALALAGCGASGPSFKNTDITGADYGKDFTLTDHAGKVRTLADFRGKVVVMFFGYTRCPDVCPTTMAELKTVKEQLGEDGKRMQVLFVTVDPERDTPKLLANYVPAFDPSFLGLYGDPAATAKVAKDFRVFYQKVPGTTPDPPLPWMARRTQAAEVSPRCRGTPTSTCVPGLRLGSFGESPCNIFALGI